MKISSNNNSIFWSLIVPNKYETSYLLGTMHVDTSFTQHVYSQVLPYLDSCKSFYPEIDFEELSSHKDYIGSFNSEQEYQLNHFLSPKKYKKLRHIISKSFHIDIDSYTQLKAIIIINLLATNLLSTHSSRSLDAMLNDYAIKNEMKIGGIEVVKDQIDLMKGFDDTTHIKQLLDISRNPSKFKQSILKLNEYYTQQDILKLYISSKKSLAKLKHKLLYERNKKMSISILEKAHSNSSFFAFGAGHLAGNYGVLNYLKQNGAVLRPIRIE